MRFIIVVSLLFTHQALSKTISVRTNETGFYSIPHSTPLFDPKTKSKNISLRNVDGEKSFFLKSNKKKFSNNDDLIFFSEKLQGQHSYQHPLDDFNGYQLSVNEEKSSGNKFISTKSLKKLPTCEQIYTNQHIEKNELLIRVNTQQYQSAPELWYWKKLTQINKKGFSIPLDFSKAQNGSNASLKVVFRGINIDKNAKDLPHHEVHVLFNKHHIGTLNWQGKTQFISDYFNIKPELIKQQNNEVTFIVPKRKVKKRTILDVVMLDYLDLKFAVQTDKTTADDALFSDKDCQFDLNENQFAYSVQQKKYALNSTPITQKTATYVGSYDELKTPVLQPIREMDIDLAQIDYMMISHPLFIDTIKPLANFYQEQGHNVAVVDINDVYQNYTYGVRELSAIKNFIKETYHAGKGRLQHVLLVGDSSWDWRNNEKYLDKYASWANRNAPLSRNFVQQKHFKYNDEIQNRDFIPTGQYHSSQGHSASDNWFVSIVPEKDRKGDDYIPDVAIGRFTAATVEEAKAMVDKSINYQKNAKVGPWKSRVLWITNANKGYQNYSQLISKHIGNYGSVAQNVFPKEMDGDNLKVQETLTNEINNGDLIVHFIGHGGNSIWRIGPPDVKKNRDLFTLDHIDLLDNKDALPFVMSMSCYSAPYDHPVADSIGEKFFRAKDKGAIAVLAASWRNAPSQSFSKAIMNEIYENPQQSLGQSIMQAKRFHRGRVALEMYNLLGDPALRLAIPTRPINTAVTENLISVSIEAKAFNGKAQFEFIDNKNQVIQTSIIDVDNPQFNLPIDFSLDECYQGRVYAWDEQQNIDAMTGFICDTPENIIAAELVAKNKAAERKKISEKNRKARLLAKRKQKGRKSAQ